MSNVQHVVKGVTIANYIGGDPVMSHEYSGELYDTSLEGLAYLYSQFGGAVTQQDIANATFGAFTQNAINSWLAANGGAQEAANQWAIAPGMIINIPNQTMSLSPPTGSGNEVAGGQEVIPGNPDAMAGNQTPDINWRHSDLAVASGGSDTTGTGTSGGAAPAAEGQPGFVGPMPDTGTTVASGGSSLMWLIVAGLAAWAVFMPQSKGKGRGKSRKRSRKPARRRSRRR